MSPVTRKMTRGSMNRGRGVAALALAGFVVASVAIVAAPANGAGAESTSGAGAESASASAVAEEATVVAAGASPVGTSDDAAGSEPATPEESASPQDEQQQRPVRWAALGDSYAAGEGLSDSEGPCHRSPGAYAPVAHDRLEDMGFPLGAFHHLACTGAETTLDPAIEPDMGHQIDQLQQIDGEPFDLITLTIGGNDAGFGDVIRTCVDPRSAPQLACYEFMDRWELWEELRGSKHNVPVLLDRWALLRLEAEQTYRDMGNVPAAMAMRVELTQYLAKMKDDDGFPVNSPKDIIEFTLTYREVEEKLFDLFWTYLLDSMDLDILRGDLDLMLYRLVSGIKNDGENILAKGGHIVILGYPRLFEDPESWPDLNLRKGGCERVDPPFARQFRRAADELNETIRKATEADGMESVHFVDISSTFEGHNLCSPEGIDAEWINGMTAGWRQELPPVRPEASFHPNKEGYRQTADLLTNVIATQLDWAPPVAPVTGHNSGVTVQASEGQNPVPLTFGMAPSGSMSVLSVLESGFNREPVTEQREMPGESCWEDDNYVVMTWADEDDQPVFSALTALSDPADEFSQRTLIGYRAYRPSPDVGFADNVRFGDTRARLETTYPGYEMTFGEPIGQVYPYELMPPDEPPVIGDDRPEIPDNIPDGPLLGAVLSTEDGTDGGSTIVERAAGEQCGIDFGSVDPDGDPPPEDNDTEIDEDYDWNLCMAADSEPGSCSVGWDGTFKFHDDGRLTGDGNIAGTVTCPDPGGGWYELEQDQPVELTGTYEPSGGAGANAVDVNIELIIGEFEVLADESGCDDENRERAGENHEDMAARRGDTTGPIRIQAQEWTVPEDFEPKYLGPPVQIGGTSWHFEVY